MKKIFLLILSLAVLFTLGLLAARTTNKDETKTSQEAGELSPDDSLTTIDSELKATELTDFDQEIQALDESINQL